MHFLLRSLVLGLFVPALLAQGTANPFSPGLRWTSGPTAGEPWIPRSVALVGSGEFVWSAPAVGNPRVRLHASSEVASPAPVLLEDDAYTGAIGPVRVAAGEGVSDLYSLAQFPGSSPTTRRTIVARYDADTAIGGTSFSPIWSHDLGFEINGPAELAVATDGSAVVFAVFDTTLQEVRVRWLEPADGSLRDEASLPATSLRAFRASADGLRVVVACGLRVFVLERDAFSPLAERVLSSSSDAIALSPDGASFAWGDGGTVQLEREGASGFATLTTHLGNSPEIAAGLSLSENGTRLAIAWWNGASGRDVRLELFDEQAGRLIHWMRSPSGSGLQDYPSGLTLTRDGRRLALGTWGLGASEAELLLFDASSSTPILAQDLGGSVLALALDPSGTRVAVAKKDAHANEFATQGAVQLHDTGERDLQLLGAARPNGAIRATAMASGPSILLFAMGMGLDSPLSFAQISGQLWLDPALPLYLLPVNAAAAGRVDVQAALGSGATFAGIPLAVQVLEFGGGSARFSQSTICLEIF